MMKLIKKIPVPMAALILALAALGNLLQTYSEGFRIFLGSLAGILFVLMIIKFLAFPKEVGNELKNPLVASVLPAFSMATMLLATYLKDLNGSLGSMMWYIGVLLHILFIIDFSLKYLANFDLKNVFPSWFIVYVGIAVASVTGPAFDRANIGRIAFWFALVSYFILLIITINRLRKYGQLAEAARPSLAIFAAPASLCLAGYINSFENKSMALVYLLLAISQLTYFIVLTKFPKLLRLDFYPSLAGLTFPMVITAMSLKLTNKFLLSSSSPIGFLGYLVKLEELIALVMVVYVLVKYLGFLIKTSEL